MRIRAMERRAFQLTVFLAAIVPVYGGAIGAWRGVAAFGGAPVAEADSQFRYLSGLLLAMGLTLWGCIPAIEQRGTIVRALSALVVVGGLARLEGLVRAGDPGSIRWTLVMELAVTPALCLWQARVAAQARRQGAAGVIS